MDPIQEQAGEAAPLFFHEAFLIVYGLVAMAAIVLWIKWDTRRHAPEEADSSEIDEVEPTLSEVEWEERFELAETVVNRTVDALPEAIRREAEKIPCLFRQWSAGLEAGEALGIYDGFEPGCVSEQGGRIVLFVGNILRYCRENELEFEDEVRTTYLHELGHHLGLDEVDLDERGL